MAPLRWLALTLCCAPLAVATPAQAAPAWLTAHPLSPDVTDNGQPHIAMAGNGDSAAIWWQRDGSNRIVYASGRPAGGAFSPPQMLDPNGDDPLIAMDASGNAVALWLDSTNGLEYSRAAAGGQFAPGQALPGQDSGINEAALAMSPSGEAVAVWRNGLTVQAAIAPPGGGFDTPKTYTAPNGSDVQVAIAPDGRAVLAYNQTNDALTATLAHVAVRPPGGAFGDQNPVGPDDQSLSLGSVAMNATGDAVVAWTNIVSVGSVKPQVVYIPAGGTPSDVKDVATATSSVDNIRADLDQSGTVHVIWSTSPSTLLSTTAAFGASFSGTPQTLTTSLQNVPALGSDAAGNQLAVWLDTDGTNNRVRAAAAPAGAPFASPIFLSPAGQNASQPEGAAMDIYGDGIASFLLRDSMNANAAVETVGYDAAGPQLRGLSVPVFPTAGAPATFAVNPVDVWSPVASTVWTFGDGQQAGGSTVSHTYTAARADTTTVTSTDALGNSSTASADSEVQDKTKPGISKASLSRRKFRAAAHGASLATAVGTSIRFTLSEPARVSFRVERCAKLRRHKCRRYKLMKGSFGKAGKLGRNSVRFTGRLRRHKLAPGLYRLRVQGVDPAGNKSKFKRLPFRVVRH